MRCALIGTGLMGFPMARRLAEAGLDLTVWNRTAEKAAPLAAHGAKPAASVEDAVAGADLVISMMVDGPASLALARGSLQAMKAGAVLCDMASVKPVEARAVADALAGRGVQVLDAPVSGGTRGAEAGTLAIMAGGDPAVLERVRPVLEHLGRPVHVGPSGAGALAKLANQGIVAVTIGAVAEAMLLLERGGADLAAVRAALKGGFADSIILQQHGARMERRDFAPGGRSDVQLKDLRNILGEAGGLGLTLPLIEAVDGRFARLCTELGGAGLDHSALFAELVDLNGGEKDGA